jgi:hypothetical protein
MKEVLSTQRSIDGPFVLDSRKFLGKKGTATALQSILDRYRPNGRVDVELNASGNWSRPGKTTLMCSIDCRGVTVNDRRFAYPIESIVGKLELDFENQLIKLKNLQGNHGYVPVTISGWSKGTGDKRQYEYIVASDKMALDNDLFEALSEGQKKFWLAFSPKGLAAIDYRASKLTDAPSVSVVDVNLINADADYTSFPYPLDNLTGKLRFERSGVTISNVVSEFEGRRIAINGLVGPRSSGKRPYDIDIEAQNITLDSTLADALSQKQRNFYDQLSMTGSADANVNVFSGRDDNNEAGFIARIHCRDSSLTIPGLERDDSDANQSRYVITGVSADAVVTQDLMGIENFTGSYGQSSVSLIGRIEFDDRIMSPLWYVTAKVDGLELDEELIALLPKTAERFTSKLVPEGKINLDIDLKKDDSSRKPEIEMIVDCLGNSLRLNKTEIPSNDVLLGYEPISHPFKNVTGKLKLANDEIQFSNMKAVVVTGEPEAESNPTLEVDGQIRLQESEMKNGWFQLTAKDIFPNRQFGTLLPESIEPLYAMLSQSGRFDLALEKVRFFGLGDRSGQISFDGVVSFEDCAIEMSPEITELNGEMEINGLFEIGQGLTDAEMLLSADSLKIKGKAIEQLRTNIYYDSELNKWLTR